MERWAGKVALVTGASAGIGAEIARALAFKGMKVIVVARRFEKLQELAADIQRKCNAEVHPIRCDVQKEEEILEVFKWAEKHLGGVDVLVNNAGVTSATSLTDESTDTLNKLVNVYVLAAAICSRELTQSVKKRNASGHIINIGSTVRHFEPMFAENMSISFAVLYAVNGMAATLRNDLAREKVDVKVTNICSGTVNTDMLALFTNVNIFTNVPALEAEDIAETVIYILSLPPRVQIWDVTLLAFHETA